jgi:hypothetical protein
MRFTLTIALQGRGCSLGACRAAASRQHTLSSRITLAKLFDIYDWEVSSIKDETKCAHDRRCAKCSWASSAPIAIRKLWHSLRHAWPSERDVNPRDLCDLGGWEF